MDLLPHFSCFVVKDANIIKHINSIQIKFIRSLLVLYWSLDGKIEFVVQVT